MTKFDAGANIKIMMLPNERQPRTYRSIAKQAGWLRENMKYAVVMEKAERNFSAFVPDLPGCIATADSIQDLEAEIRKAIAFHIDGLKEDGLPVPEPSCSVDYVEI